MVASYSLTQANRSGSLPKLLTTVTTGLKAALDCLRSVHIDHGPSHHSLNAQDVLAAPPSLEDQLAPLPSHTFGYQWLTQIKQTKHSQAITPPHPFISGLHVLTGYGTDTIGQAELQAFLMGATGNITALWQYAETLHNRRQSRPFHPSALATIHMAPRLYQAYQRGQTSYFKFEHWHPEQLWDLPLEYVRQWFGIPNQ